MIYTAYQGTGKSTLSYGNSKYVDLESSMFWLNGKRIDDWEKIYVQVAKDLSNQGKDVFVSSHEAVRKYMNEQGIDFVCIYPALELKDQWIKKLENRYILFATNKNRRALEYAKENFDENIKDLSKEENRIVITNMNYDLDKLIKDYND